MATLNASLNLREEVPVNIVKGANLERTMNDLFKNFEAGEQRNAELVNRFFDQRYFRGEESLLNKLTELKPDITFNDIGDEGINLATLQYDNQLLDFMYCINKITDDEIKKAFIKEIHDKVQTQLGTIPAYGDFNNPNKCGIPGDTDVLGYFQKVVNYLTGKESTGGAEKTIKILEGINISNNDLNTTLLTTGRGIPAGINLIDPSIPADTKNAFDLLLSFEIGKEADRTTNIAKDISDKLEGLFSNTFPAINTIISENDEYKYDENKLTKKYPEYQGELQAITDNPNLSDKDKTSQINNLKWGYYLKYLKTKNSKIGNALEQLYNNDFDYSKIDIGVLKNYIDKVVDSRIRILFNSGAKDIIKINFGNLDSFKDFCKDLADPTKNNVSLRNVNLVPGGTVNIPIKKSIIEGKHPRLKDITEFGGTEKSYDALPIRYEINKSDIDNLDITIEDKTMLLNFLSRFSETDKYIIEGESIGMLIYLFFVINSRTPLSKFNSDEQKKIQDLFGRAKNETKDLKGEDNNGEDKENKDGNNDTENKEGEDDNEDKEVTEEYTPEKFKEDIEKLGPGKFVDGSEIWLPMGESELPGGGYQWMKLKINNIDMKKGTFKGKVFGGELKFNDKLEGKSKEFKMDKEFFDNLEKISKDSKKIWLLPDSSKSDFNSFKDSLNGKLGTNELTFPITGVSRNGKNFMQKILDDDGKEKEVEVKYFGASSDDKSTYKIEYNPIKKSFTVSSSFNGEEKGKDGKSEKKRLSYKRDMDWNNFLIFFTQKGLVPQTEEEASSAIARQDQEFKMLNGGHWKLNWFSINNIKNVFKTLKGNIKKKIDDYNKAQDDKLQDIIVGDRGIYNKLAGVLGFIPSMKNGLGELQQEYYNERDNKTRKKIEYYLKIFQSDPDFGTTFDQVPPHAKIQGGKSLQMIITDRVKNAKDRMGDPGIYQAAALLLANFEKGGSPYRGLSDKENTGLWVKALLGKAHYEQFLRDKAACIRDRDLAETTKESGLDKKGLNEALSRCEMDYIINNIRGAYGKLPYFGSHENRGIPGKDGTNYIDNPAKRLLSDQFANKLENASKGWYTKSTVEESYGKNKSINNFEIMEDEFGKMGSSRYQKGAGALRRMFDLASDESLKRRAKRHFLTYLLSGALDINCDPGLKKQVYGWAKPMSFVPGMLVKEAGVAENIAVLLDDATNGDFSKNVTKYFHRSGQLKSGPDFKGLQAEINKWLTDEKMDLLDVYFSKLPTKDFSDVKDPKKKAILQKFKNSLIDEDVEEFDRGLLDNPKMVNNGLLTSINVISDRLSFDDGEFRGKDSDDINNKKSFWKDIKEDIKQRNANDEGDVNFVLNKYFNRFGLSSSQDRQDTYQWIKTAYHRKQGTGKSVKFKYKGNILDMGKITDTEIQDIVRYTFKGRVMKNRFSARKLPSELDDALNQFQNFFKEAFNQGTLEKSTVESDAFKSKGKKIEIMPIGSNALYKDLFSGDDYTFDDGTGDDDISNPKQYRKARKNAFQNGGFINHEMAQIEKYFKNRLPSNAYRPITKSTSHDVNKLIELL